MLRNGCQERKLTAINVFIHKNVSGVESTSDPHFARLGRTTRLPCVWKTVDDSPPKLMRSCANPNLYRKIARTPTGKRLGDRNRTRDKRRTHKSLKSCF